MCNCGAGLIDLHSNDNKKIKDINFIEDKKKDKKVKKDKKKKDKKKKDKKKSFNIINYFG
jgi:hypothetical protein